MTNPDFVTDWQGTPTIHAGEAIATNGKVLEEVLAMTRRPPTTIQGVFSRVVSLPEQVPG